MGECNERPATFQKWNKVKKENKNLNCNGQKLFTFFAKIHNIFL